MMLHKISVYRHLLFNAPRLAKESLRSSDESEGFVYVPGLARLTCTVIFFDAYCRHFSLFTGLPLWQATKTDHQGFPAIDIPFFATATFDLLLFVFFTWLLLKLLQQRNASVATNSPPAIKSVFRAAVTSSYVRMFAAVAVVWGKAGRVVPITTLWLFTSNVTAIAALTGQHPLNVPVLVVFAARSLSSALTLLITG
eukprot:Trichotokara_eunicae@DN3543_c0_g2_i1.p1